MSLPFTPDEFLGVFGRYNEAVWPAQLVLHMMSVACVAALPLRGKLASRLICAALALLWAWAGLAYHLQYFADINPAAWLFAALFVAGAAIFAWEGVLHGRLRFAFADTPRCALGFGLLAYALLVYPLLSISLGHAYPTMPTFGLPCPTTIFTIGMLAFLGAPYPRYVLAVPLGWVVIATQAAFLFGMYEDLGLLAAGVAGIWFVFDRPRKEHPA